ncbi:Hydrolase, alpha/beta fold family protein [Zostera marina]|uniref:Hydrolase, alpha/beta fold family protein n=1 Tax=Zostera marina TaxID=29655 RepID=A0A0K9PM68_ZOSMR|nr:Hydrolase, alpha/beta fold family protein [Zostera marina]
MAFAMAACTSLCVRAAESFPAFLPREVEQIRDPYARDMARRIERLPVQTNLLKKAIMTSCVRSVNHQNGNQPPIVLLHGFDSSCLEWRYTFPLLEDAGLEAWAFDILGWGFSDLETLPSCDVASKREHLYQFWNTYLKKPMILVGPSLGAAVSIDFASYHPEAVSKLILIDASVFAEGTGNLAKLPRMVAYAGASVLKSVAIRFYANTLTFKNISASTNIDRMNVGRLHCRLPWWKDATVDFMLSGGYNVSAQIEKIKQKVLIIWGMEDKIIEPSLALKLNAELPDSVLLQIPDCGHIPHIEKPESLTKFILDFI